MSPYTPLYVVGRYTAPAPQGTRVPWQYPFASDSIWNTAIGSGLTYVPTSDPMHTQAVTAGGNLNISNWTDPVYLANSTDPLVTVQHRTFLPAGWDVKDNTYIGTPNGGGLLVKEYIGVRVPLSAAWQSTSNTDRKVLVVQPAVTVTIKTYDYNGNGALLSTVTETYPAGTLSVEIHKFYRTTNSALIYATNLSRNDVRYYGLKEGAIASGIAPTGGSLRNFEVAAAVAGDVHAFAHVAKLGLPNSKLKAGKVWPARLEDGDSATAYTGAIPMGSHLSLPPSVDIESLTITSAGATTSYPVGTPFTPAQKAIAYMMQDYGGLVLIRAGSGPIVLSAEPRNVVSSSATNMLAGWKTIVPLLRVSANYASVGTLDSDRMPVDRDLIAGGGTRRRPPLDPISPTGPWA